MARPRLRKGRRGRIGERLRAARAARGLTQVQAAAELGVSWAALSAWETGSLRPGELARRYLELWCAGALGEPAELPGRPPAETEGNER